MTPIVHIANTNVEFEFAQSSLLPLEQSWSRHPLCLQLQFLPLLYAKPYDSVAVTALPSQAYLTALQQTSWWPQGLPHLVLLQDVEPFKNQYCQSWGPSREVQAWAKARHLYYELPADWQIIRLVNSKAFSFRYTCLQQAALLYDEQELRSWLKNNPGNKLLKTCFGLSGQGNRHINQDFLSPEILAFCHKEWQQKRPLIAEPLLDRISDFSTQWFIHSKQHIEYIGATRFETDAHGTYQGTLAGPENHLFSLLENFLQEHKKIVQKALEDMASMGFFGSVGIDALLYRHSQTQAICLYPLVEINARQTLSFVALRLQQRLCPHNTLSLKFKKNNLSQLSLLPDHLINSKGKTYSFSRRLTIECLH